MEQEPLEPRAVDPVDEVVTAVAGFSGDDFGGSEWELYRGTSRWQGEEGRGGGAKEVLRTSTKQNKGTAVQP
jgi:hypothetical protein